MADKRETRFKAVFAIQKIVVNLALCAGLVLMLLVLIPYLLDLCGFAINPAIVILLTAILSLLFLFWSRRNLDVLGKIGPNVLPSFLLVLLGVMAYSWWLGRPSELPVGTTVDAVHQFGIADYIVHTRHLPLHDASQQLNLQDGLQYPPAFAILAALLAQISGLNVIYLLHPIASFFTALACGCSFIAAYLLVPKRFWRSVLAGFAAGATLIPFDYTFGSFTSQNYYAQIVAEGFLMLSLLLLILWQRYPVPPLLTLNVLAILTLIICYPTLAVIPFAALLLLIVTNRKLGWRKIFNSLTFVSVPTLLLGFLFLKDRLAAGIGTLSNEGEVTSPNLAYYSWPVVILAVVGLVSILFRRDITARIAALFSLLTAGEGFCLWWAKFLWGRGSYYAVYKLFYPAAFLLPILAVIGLVWLGSLLFKLKSLAKLALPDKKVLYSVAGFLGAMLIFGLFLAMIWTQHSAAIRPYPAITDDEVKAATWAQQHLKLKEYSFAYNLPPGTPAYWLQIGFFKQPRDTHSDDLLNNPPTTFANWLYDQNAPQYLFTDSLEQISPKNCCNVLYQSGNVGIVERAVAFVQQQQSANNVVVQYNTALTGNLLSLRMQANTSQAPSEWLQMGLEIEAADANQPVFSAILPVEKGRTNKPQFLGVVVQIPDLSLREFYSNNDFPPKPPATAPLTSGQYNVYIVLQKNQSVIQRKKLLQFEYAPQQPLTFQATLSDLNNEITLINPN